MKKKILKLNEAYTKIKCGIKAIKIVFKSVSEIIKQANEVDRQFTKLNRMMLKELKKKQLQEDWDRLVIKLKKEK